MSGYKLFKLEQLVEERILQTQIPEGGNTEVELYGGMCFKVLAYDHNV